LTRQFLFPTLYQNFFRIKFNNKARKIGENSLNRHRQAGNLHGALKGDLTFMIQKIRAYCGLATFFMGMLIMLVSLLSFFDFITIGGIVWSPFRMLAMIFLGALGCGAGHIINDKQPENGE